MHIMKKIFLSAMVIASLQLQAQVSFDYLKAADAYYRKADYASASSYYEKYLAGNGKKGKGQYDPYTVQSLSKAEKHSSKTNQQAVYNLAECYRLLTYYSKAEPFYKESVGFDKQAYPVATYRYAMVLKALEQYQDAEKYFQDFLGLYKVEDGFTASAKQELKNLAFIQVQLKRKDLALFTTTKAGAQLNAAGASYAPVWLNGNTLLFTSTRADEDAAKGYVNRVYQAAYANNAVSAVSKVALPQDKNMHQGVVSATPDGKTLFITRWKNNSAKKSAAIYRSTATADGWNEPVLLGSGINTPGFNTQQPSVTADGKYLLFASDRPGGQGGFDLWYAPLDAKGEVGQPVNLGNLINTAADEQAPFMHGPSQSLVFASNGRTGMGGFDLYQSKGTFSNWSEPQNLGYPVNSVKDDLYFISRSQSKNILADVLLSSDRASECCLDLFSLQKKTPLKQISGQVVACDNNTPLAGVNVTIVDPIHNSTLLNKTTNADGSYMLEVEDYRPLKVVAQLPGYENGALAFDAPADVEQNKLLNPVLCLVK